MYTLEYLPAAREDLIAIMQYISGELKNPAAAERLAADLAEAGERVREYPYAAPAYWAIRPLKREYRKLVVKHFLMFYWVDEEKKTVTIARVVYARRDYKRLLD